MTTYKLIVVDTNQLNQLKDAPNGDIVGASDTQILTNKTLTDSTTFFQDETDNTKKAQFQISTVAAGQTRVIEIPNSNGRIVYSPSGSQFSFSNIGNGNGVVIFNGGLGNIVGDRMNYVGGSGYPFFSGIDWTNLSLVQGAIAFENVITPFTYNPTAAYTLLAFPGILQTGAFQVSTNGSGRLTNNDGLTWSFLINFSCSLTGNNNSEWEICLFINGVKASNSYTTTVSSNGRYTSLGGIWVNQVNGSSVNPPAVANQYCEIYMKRNVGAGNVSVKSAFLSISAQKLLNMP